MPRLAPEFCRRPPASRAASWFPFPVLVRAKRLGRESFNDPSRDALNRPDLSPAREQDGRKDRGAGGRNYVRRAWQMTESTRCDLLLTNAQILTMDERFSVWKPGSLAIDGDTILAVGT